MKFYHPKNLLSILSFIVISLFLACTEDNLLEETDALYAPKLVATTTNSITLTPVQDAHLTGNTRYNLPIIGVSENYRVGYIMFDLSKIEGEITSATLQFTIKDNPGNGKTRVFLGTNNSWTENNLSPQNRPMARTQLGNSTKSYPIGAIEKISLSPEYLIKAKNTLVLWHEDGKGYTFASRETTTPPKLTITYTSTSSQASKPSFVPQGYYVTVNGKATNTGKSESTAWSLEHAFDVAKAGDIIYVKAGDYKNPKLVLYNGGISGKPIKFIGYSNTPGDVISNNGSTFKYRDQVDPNKMPLLRSSIAATGTAIIQYRDYVEFENFQITGYRTGIQSDGNYVVLRNIVATNLGSQTTDRYDGFGLMVTGKNSLIENCYILNAGAEGIKLTGANYSKIRYCSIYSDNPNNPSDYYFLIVGGTNNALIENSIANRASGLSHGGHGFALKDWAENNIVRNCTAYRTSFELNYGGVKNNIIDKCKIYGEGTSSSKWQSRMAIFNGANNNLIRDMYIENTWAAITWEEYKDGYIGPGGDRREENCGYDNTYERITVKNTNRVLNVGGGTNYSAFSKRNTFVECDFSNFQAMAVTYYPTESIKFKSTKFSYGKSWITEYGGAYAKYSNFNATFENCTWANNSFKTPQ